MNAVGAMLLGTESQKGLLVVCGRFRPLAIRKNRLNQQATTTQRHRGRTFICFGWSLLARLIGVGR